MELELIQDVRQAGWCLTPQRRIVIAVLAATRAHLTALEILARARRRLPRLNKAAVYRALDLLVHLSVVNPIDLGLGDIHYELNCQSHHHHRVCRRCGQIANADESVLGSLERDLRTRYGFAPFL